MIIPNIAEYEQTDSQLAKQTILDLHCEIDRLIEENERLKEEIENLTHIVANKIIEDYDIDTPLKNQLNEERIKYINLSVVCNDYKSRNEKAIELLNRLQKQYGYILEDVIFLLLQGEDKDE